METYFSNMTARDGMKEKLVEDLAVLVRDAEALVRAAGGSVAEKTKAELNAALDRMKIGCQRLERKALTSARQADEVIRQHPYHSLGVALAAGLLIGVLAGRSGRD